MNITRLTIKSVTRSIVFSEGYEFNSELLSAIITLSNSVDGYVIAANKYASNEISNSVDNYVLATNKYLEI